MPMSAVDVVSPALEHTKQQLFRPIRWRKWARVALLGLATGELSSTGCPGGGFNFSLPPTHTGNSSRSLLALPSVLHNLSVLQAALLITGLIVVMFVFMVLFLYANSICRFILFDCVLTGRCVLGEGWNRWRPQGRRFFVWQLGLGVVMMAAMALVIGFPVAIAIAIGMTWHSRQHPVLMVLGVLFVIFGAMAISIASMLAMVLAKDFVVPQMALENLGVMEAWQRLLAMMRAEPKGYAGYIGMKIVLAIGAAFIFGIASVIVTLAVFIPIGIVAAIVIIGGKAAGLAWNLQTIALAAAAGCLLFAVLLYLIALVSAPATVFFPAYSMHFFAARYPALYALLHAVPPTPPPSPEPATG